MGRIPEQTIEEVLARTDILQVVQQYIALKRSGVNWKGLCPFHGEKTPSFYVHPGKGIYKCFGCGVGGDVISFVMQLEGWSFSEALRQLAARAGVQIEEEDEEEAEEARKRRQARELYQKIMKLAQGYFAQQLMEPAGEEARAYLERRGVSAGVREAFGLGYAPESWQNLLDYLHHEGIKGALVERAGLALARQSGDGFYDRFRHRVIFPVIDIWGNTLAFGGRVLRDEDTPKYLNSPETKFYTKGKQLFGLHAAKQAIQRADMALLVEGNFDVITLHAQGIQTAIAPMGTAFTEDQARLLGRYTRRVVVLFDGDRAGEEATLRSLSSMEAAGLEAHVVRLEPGEDPDTFVRAHGPEALLELAKAAPPLIGWALERVLTPTETAPVEEKLKALEAAGEVFGQIRNKIVWQHYAEELERRLKVDPSLYKRYLKRDGIEPKAKRSGGGSSQAVAPPSEEVQDQRRAVSRGPKIELERAEMEILVLLCGHPMWIEGFLGEELENMLMSGELAAFLHEARAYFAEHSRLDGAVLVGRQGSSGFGSVLAEALAQVGMGKFEAEEFAEKMYQDTLRTLKRSWAKRSLEDIDRQIERLDIFRDREQYRSCLEQKKLLEQFAAQQG
jgi:DNA primase